jgi:tetratricopeptide (TPR) repeat protein
MRSRILEEQGIAGLEPAYEAMLARPDAASNLAWFAGYSSLVAAEFHRRKGATDEALAAYDRAIAHYQRAIENNPGSRASSDHYVAVALGGQARLHLERGDLERALDAIVASFQRAPDSASALDGLNLSTVDTAKMLRSKLRELQQEAPLARLQAALDALDPSQLELPAYERETPPSGQGAGSAPGGNGRRPGRGR